MHGDAGWRWIVRVRLATIGAVVLAACNGSPSGAEAIEAEIQGGAGIVDVTVGADGRVALGDPRQWARDASVRLSNGCSGTLVSPRVVITAGHCVRRSIPSVTFSPFNPSGGVGSVVPGTPLPPALAAPGDPVSATLDTVRCALHPERDGFCGDGFDFVEGTDPYMENDLAMLVLSQRLDTTSESLYRVVPAQIVEDDPYDPVIGTTVPERWLDVPVTLAGYGRRGLNADAGIDRMRMFAVTEIALVGPRDFYTREQRGYAGDSGCGVFWDRSDDGSPLRLLGVKSSGNGTADIAVRLTASGMQAFMSTFLGPKVDHYAGEMVSVLDGTSEVWTGDPDFTRRGYGVRPPEADILDPDQDGLVGRHDNCWGFYNPMQNVNDATRTFSCVHPLTGVAWEYPCAPRPTTFPAGSLGIEGTNDQDRDGVPDACDSCPANPDRDQEDCNADAVAEVNRALAMSGMPTIEPLADVCDPVPCARTELVAESTTTGLVRRTRFDRIDVDAVHAAPPRGALTGFRFCRCDAAGGDTTQSRTRCALAGGDAYDQGCTLADPDEYDGMAESVPWRFVTMTDSLAGDPLPLDSEVDVAYSRPADSRFLPDWQGRFRLHQDDLPRWRTTPLSPLDGPETFPSGALHGVFWTHTRAYSGATSLDPDTRRLANHYLSGAFSPPVDAPAALRRFVEPIAPLTRGWDWFGRRSFLVRDSRIGSGIGTMIGNSVTPPVDVNELTSLSRLAADGRWVPAAESTSELGNTVVRYVALTPAGIRSRVGEVNGAFVDLDDPQCIPGQCTPTDGPQFAALASNPPPFDPTHEVSVLSATRRQFFALRDATADRGAELATCDLDSGVWTSRSVDTIGDVLAATYSARDEVLWVLDQIRVGRHRYARILAVVPESGHATESARWLRVTPHDRFEIAVTSDRGLYIAAGIGGAHAVARLDLSFDGVRLRGIRAGAGALPPDVHALRADDSGVSVLTRSGRDYTLSDHTAESFTAGWMGACL